MPLETIQIETGANPMPGQACAFLARGTLPATDDPIPFARYEQVLRELDASGDFETDGPGGGPLLEPCALLFEGRSASGEPIVLAAVTGVACSAS